MTQVEDLDHAEGVYVATSDGDYRSTDRGDTWAPLGVRTGDRYWTEGDSLVFAVHAAPEGTLYAVTNFPAIHR